MSEGTVTSAYNAARRSRDSQGQGSRSSDPDDLMRGRTFIPRMSEASRQLMIEALQKAKKNRQERVASRKKAKIDERTRPSLTAAEEETKDLIKGASEISSSSREDALSRTGKAEIMQLETPTRNTVLREVLRDIGIEDEAFTDIQLTSDPKAWFSHLSGEPIEDRLTRLRDKQKGSTDPVSIALSKMTDDEISAYARRIEDNIPSEEKTAYNDSKRGYRHREVQRFDNKLREQKENAVLSEDEQDLLDAQNTQKRSLRTLSPEVSIMNAMSQLPEGTIEGAVEQGISPAIRALKSLANGGKIPKFKRRTLKFR
jgi:hypothetical protein